MKKYQFYIQKFKEISKIGILCSDYEFQLVQNYFFEYFTDFKKNNIILSKIQKNVFEDFGSNDFSINFNNKEVVFDLFFDKYGMDIEKVLPYRISIVEFVSFLNDIQLFISKYESCQIPGIIPPSKLDTWSCVPNEYVKPEYWELLKQQEPDKSN